MTAMGAVETADAVPMIDISGYRSGAEREKLRIAREIDAACRRIGFLVVSGHGVPDTVVERADRATRALFDLPTAVKDRYAPAPGVFRGYHGLESNAIAYSLDDHSAPPDLFERYAIGPVDVDRTNPWYARTEMARAAYAPNVWPDEVPDFAQAMTDYYRAMDKLSLTLMRLFALALGLDEFWFDDKVDKHMTQLVVQNYPDQDKPPRPGQLRCGPHSDYGSLTVLKSENKPGGLEVRTREGQWKPVRSQPGAFIINLGDLMAQWTNDRWVSTMHRVVNPPRDMKTGTRRQSLIFFHQPNYDAMIECIPSCLENGQAKYKPITSGEHLFAKVTKQLSV
jgi:isopenicillin N synthase-like dioxygenase